MYRYPAQLVGDSTTIEQHVTDTRCSKYIPRKLKLSYCRPCAETLKIIVWEDPHHDPTIMKNLGNHKIKRSGDYVLIESLFIGGAIQRELGKDKSVIQLDNGIIIRKINTSIDIYHALQYTLKDYTKRVGTDVMAPILEAHLASVIMEQKNDMIREWERTCFIQR